MANDVVNQGASGSTGRFLPRGAAQVFTGALLLAVAVYGLREDIRWIAQPFYAWVWWGYILILDGFSSWRRGDSLLTKRREFVAPICIWSVTFWMFFELVNSRIQNWYYVGVYPDRELLAGAVFTVLAFATVFMGIFQTYDAVTAAGLWRDWRGKRRVFPRRLTYILQGIGFAMGGAALLFPHYLAPLVWGSFTLIVDPWNYRRGTRSLLRDVENGDWGLIARLLLAGLICGVVWESLNFFAPQKWIYTVRGLEAFKLFEMPLLGFLGFPALALDCTAAFALFASLFLGNRSWERDEDRSYALTLCSKASASAFWGGAVVQVAFWGAVAQFATPVNVGSLQLELGDIGLQPEEIRRLESMGVTRPRQLIRKTETEAARAEFLRETGWGVDRFETIRDRAELFTFKGIGRNHGDLLERVGVRTPDDLCGWKPEALYARMRAVYPTADPAELSWMPRLDFVRVWVLAARDRGVLLNGGEEEKPLIDAD